MRIVGWITVTVSFVVAGYCAALSLLGVLGPLVLWADPHAAVAILAVSGVAGASLILRRAGDEAVAAVAHLRRADQFIADLVRSAVGRRRAAQLTVLTCPGDRVVVIRGSRRAMVLVPDGIEPTEAARLAARDLALGRGWVLPWVIRVIRLPGMYAAAIAGGLRLSIRTLVYSRDRHRAESRAMAYAGLALFAIPATAVGWVASQLAMMLVPPRLLAAYVAVSAGHVEDGRLGMRGRLLLPLTWYECAMVAPAGKREESPAGAKAGVARTAKSGAARAGAAKPGATRTARAAASNAANPEAWMSLVVLAASFLMIGALYLVVAPVEDRIVWWDERPVTGTVREVAVVDHESTPPRLAVGWHPTQQLTVELPGGERGFVKSAAADYEIGDPIQLAETSSGDDAWPYLRAVPSKSANGAWASVVFGFGWAALFALPITYQGNREDRDDFWAGTEAKPRTSPARVVRARGRRSRR